MYLPVVDESTAELLFDCDVDALFSFCGAGGVDPDVDCGGEFERFEFDELVEDVVLVCGFVVEFCARSRVPDLCCCSRCNLQARKGNIL